MTVASFTTIARPNPGGVLLIEVHASAIRSLGDRKLVPVRVKINGVRYRSTIAVYGERFVEIREKIRPARRA